MSSTGLENSQRSFRTSSFRTPAERSLLALKMHGSLTTAALGHILGTTGEAARQHLVRLAEEGLVEATAETNGIGRPARNWRLTSKALERFPDTHAVLSVQLLQILRTELGEAAVDTLIELRERRMLEAYKSRLAGLRHIRDKLGRLAEIRNEDGYMAEVVEEAAGTFVLIENHCPICAAARECRQFCAAEKSLFEALLGPDVAIERIDHIVAGANRCAYRITEMAG